MAVDPIWTGAGLDQPPTFNASDFGTYWYGQGGTGDSYQQGVEKWGLTNSSPYGTSHWANMSEFSPNYRLSYDPNDKSRFNVLVKSAEKEGTPVEYRLVDGQYVPMSTGAAQYWDTNPGKQNMHLAMVLAAGLGGAAMGAMAGAGAGAAGAGAGAGAGGAVAPGALIGAGESAAALWPGATGFATGGGAAGVGAAAPYLGGAAGAAGGVGGAGSAGGAAGGASGGLGGLGSAMPSSWGDWLSTIGGVGGALNNWLPIAGAIGGALEGNQDTTTSSGPPDYLRNAGAAASQIPFTPYGGASPQYSQNPMFGMDNPYLQKQIDAATGDIQKNFNQTTAPMLDAMNSRANTGFGTSSAMDEMRGTAYEGLNKQLAQTSNDMRFKDYYNQSQLGEGNAARQNAFGQQQQNFNYQEFLRSQNYPDVQLARLGIGNPNVNTTPGAGWLQGAIGGYMGGLGAQGMIGGAQSQQPPIRNDQFYNSVYGFGGDQN